jgi:hypothetical protein
MEITITQKQIDYIKQLLQECGYEKDEAIMVKIFTGGATDVLENMDRFQASRLIDELQK